jgi:hypothetical protein
MKHLKYHDDIMIEKLVSYLDSDIKISFIDNHINTDMLIEMVSINGNEIPYDVCVFGGNSYGGGRNEHGEPHFHFSDNINNYQKFKLSIIIPKLTEWNNIKDLKIIEKDSSQKDWLGLRKEKKLLIEWLDKSNYLVPSLTNYQLIKVQWNILNKDNKNVRKILD